MRRVQERAMHQVAYITASWRLAMAGVLMIVLLISLPNETRAQPGGYGERTRDNPFENVAPTEPRPRPYWRWSCPFGNEDEETPEDEAEDPKCQPWCERFCKAFFTDDDYYDGFFADNPNPPARRGLGEAFSSPPYPGNESKG